MIVSLLPNVCSPQYGSLSETSKFLSVTGYRFVNLFHPVSKTLLTMLLHSTMFLLEYPRLAVGYFGNLFQRPPLLMAFWLITVLIHVPIQTLLLFAAGMRQLPIEVVLDAVIFLFLLVEAAAGLMAVRKTILKIMAEVSSRNGEQSPVVAKD